MLVKKDKVCFLKILIDARGIKLLLLVFDLACNNKSNKLFVSLFAVNDLWWIFTLENTFFLFYLHEKFSRKLKNVYSKVNLIVMEMRYLKPAVGKIYVCVPKFWKKNSFKAKPFSFIVFFLILNNYFLFLAFISFLDLFIKYKTSYY